MAKVNLLAIIATVMFALTACGGGGNKQGSSTSDETASKEQSATTKGGEMFDIQNSQIETRRWVGAELQKVEGADRDKWMAKVPAFLKKGIGDAQYSVFSVEESGAGDGSVVLALIFRKMGKGGNLDAAFGENAYPVVKEYYKSLGGKVTFENETACQMTFDWGKTIQCETNASQIFVIFNIK